MKKIYAFTSLIFLFTLSISILQAQCTELFFSEYVEGSHNNKALELYNPSSDSIALNMYRVVRFSNGSIDQKTQETINLPDSKIGPNGTFVIVLDIRQPGTGADTPVFAGLQAKADAFLCPSCNPSTSPSRALCFNGDDAIGLQKNVSGTWTTIDIFGKIGERPTNSWTDAFPHNNNIGAYWTRDQTLVRKNTVKQGVTKNPDFFDPTAEWDSLPRNTFDSLGGHRCDCSKFPASVRSFQNTQVSIFPNPGNANQTIQLVANNSVREYTIQTVMGRKVSSIHPESNSFKLNTAGLTPGIYLITLVMHDQKQITQKLIIK